MRVKDILETIGEWNLSDSNIWFLYEDKKLKGNILSWRYTEGKLIGLAHPACWADDKDIGCLRDLLRIIKLHHVCEDTRLYLDVPGRALQEITNWRYDGDTCRFSSEIWWEKNDFTR